MKKLIALTLAVMLWPLASAFADNDTPIQVSELPAKAQAFLSTYYKGQKILLAKVESEVLNKTYDVIFEGGTKVKFNKSGVWTEVNAREGAVPQALIPEEIRSYVNAHFPDAIIHKIEREHKEYEIKLSNRLEITFDSKFRVIDIDD